jgi:hypothetical protein
VLRLITLTGAQAISVVSLQLRVLKILHPGNQVFAIPSRDHDFFGMPFRNDTCNDDQPVSPTARFALRYRALVRKIVNPASFGNLLLLALVVFSPAGFAAGQGNPPWAASESLITGELPDVARKKLYRMSIRIPAMVIKIHPAKEDISTAVSVSATANGKSRQRVIISEAGRVLADFEGHSRGGSIGQNVLLVKKQLIYASCLSWIGNSWQANDMQGDQSYLKAGHMVARIVSENANDNDYDDCVVKLEWDIMPDCGEQ